MYQFLAISFSIFLVSGGLVYGQSDGKTFEIRGRVLDAETNRPLPGVNVFLDQTLQGASTDRNGWFEIANIEPGSHILVASMVGYEIVNKAISIPEVSSKKFLIGLTPSVQNLPKVLVKADRPGVWYRNLDRFKEVFLGYTENGSDTEITNPLILQFQNEDGRLITTTQNNPLLLKNQSLGYKIEFYIRSVIVGENRLDTFGFSNYSELDPENEKELKRWKKQRKETYLGSFRHFIQALANNELGQEGFKIFYADTVEDIFDEKLVREIVKSDSAKEKIYDSSEILASTTSQEQLQLINPRSKYLGVIYTRESVERKIERIMNARPDYQVSLIELPRDTASLEVSSGNYQSPYRPILHGYWGFSNRLPDLLPNDFDTSIFYKKGKIKNRLSLEEREVIENPGKDVKTLPDSLSDIISNPFFLSTNIALEMDLRLPVLEKVSISPRRNWKMGNTLIQNGNYELALDLWKKIDELYQQYEIESTDPRIGFLYIETVTDQNFRDRYEKASELYYWGLENVSDFKYKEVLAKEVERLEPITDKETQEKWKKLLENNRLNELGQSIKTFWEMRDPTLATPFNERLLEHWERLAFVKDRFTRNHAWAYGTDDRAKIYVAYGKPDFMGNNRRKSKNEIIDNSISGSTNTESKSVGTTIGIRAQGGSQALSERASNSENQRQQVQQLGEVLNFSYNLWSYSEISPEYHQDIIFLFGIDGDTKEYRLLDGVEEMIPSKYFLPICAFNARCNPIPMQKALYYSLSVEHNFFSRFLTQLERLEWMRDTPPLVAAKIVRAKNEATLAYNRTQAPPDHSEYEAELPEIPLSVYQYRMLNTNNEPFLATFIESRPHQGLFFDQVKEKTFDMSAYSVLHSYALAGINEAVSFRNSESTKIQEDYGWADKMQPSVTYVEIPNLSKGSPQVFTAELHNQTKPTEDLNNNLFSERVRGLGRHRVIQPEPLSTDKNILEVSDLIIGYADGSESSTEPFGFQVVPEGQIPKGKDIVVHFEVYHLEATANRSATFNIQYFLEPEKGFLGNLFKEDKQVSLTLNFETMERAYRDNLEIDTSELDAGKYNLSFTVTETGSEREKRRQISFEIKAE